jgi:hypothetical protein
MHSRWAKFVAAIGLLLIAQTSADANPRGLCKPVRREWRLRQQPMRLPVRTPRASA